MQKKLIVLALAAISAAPAFAQSNVTIYGRVDYGYVARSGDSGGIQNVDSTQEFQSGVQAGSRLGFRGTEDLGNGLKAIFEIETGLSNDEQGTAAGRSGLFSTNRHSYVGLTGNWGTVVGGRLDGIRYNIYNKYDAFAGGTVGNFTQMTLQVDRASNAVAYISPRFGGGFQVTTAYATNEGVVSGHQAEAIGNVQDGQLFSLMGNYENGPISLTLDYEQVNNRSGGGPLNLTGDGDAEVITVAGSYDFGVVKIAGLWDTHESNFGVVGGANNVDYDAYFISATVPFMGKFTGKFTWGQVDNNLTVRDAFGNTIEADSDKWGIGLDYAFSKRTNIYVDYGKISNDSGSFAQISALANSQRAGLGVKGFDLGIAHKF